MRAFPAILLAFALLVGSQAQAKPKFNASEIAGACSELMIGDLDGDGLKDLVLVNGLDLALFYQAPARGFTREPQQTYHLEPRPCLVCTAKLGGAAASVLVLNSEGVTELCFTNRTGPPAIRPIIRQPTVVPETADGTNAVCLPFSVGTGGDRPLLLVPAADGLQVWSFPGSAPGEDRLQREEWRQVQLISRALDERLWPSMANPGYTCSLEFDLSVGGVNSDGREDLMVRRRQPGRTNLFSLYVQQANGLLVPEPTLTYADKADPFSWVCWTDVNRDGKVDLVKSVWLNEPSFVPGVPSGKALVSVYTADEHGRIPPQPQQVFRKHDWLAALPVLDVDGDGYPDLVLGFGHIDSREGLRKQITARQLDYTLRFYFYRPGAGFPSEADCQRAVVIHLQELQSPLDWELPQNFRHYAKVGGDFSGDGKADLLVRDRRGAISVYFFVSRTKGFSLEPDLLFNCLEPIESWQVADLNGDGISDLIVKLAKEEAFRVFISRR